MLLRGRRRTALWNLAVAFPDRTERERRRVCQASFQHLGTMVIEVALLLLSDPSRLLSRVSVEGIEHLRAAADGGRGVLALTAHFGNWELLGVAHTLLGLPATLVVRPLDSAFANRLAERLRVRTGAELVAKRRALRPVLRALRRGRMVGILLDQNASRAEGVFVPFFGRPASTSRSLALLSLRSAVPIVPVFIHRERDGRHRIVIEPAIAAPPSGPPEAAIFELTAECVRRTEATIRRWPEQWLWLHRRWRTSPVRP